jgi:hypothetical protein
VITTVRFDVHGADALEIQDHAVAALTRFSGGSLEDWTVDIEVHEESRVSDGRIATWRGEVTAMRYELST